MVFLVFVVVVVAGMEEDERVWLDDVQMKKVFALVGLK